ncbi:MAG: ATP-grasp domain-containing protein [Methanolobus sp.]|nr:ATP-grasp domain-containing protein [Methanolobus sp.]
MKILLAEYATGIGLDGTLLKEGKAMLSTLVNSFQYLGHDVTYLTAGSKIKNGNPIISDKKTFEQVLEEAAKESDAGLVIGPDELLGDMTDIIERNTINLGCPADTVRLCADKLLCTQRLELNSICVPKILDPAHEGKSVIKPRYGCASEGVRLKLSNTGENAREKEQDCISTEYVEGEHLSVSIICGQRTLPLSLNKQFIDIIEYKGETIFDYKGNQVPYRTEHEEEIIQVATRTVEALGCNGYAGVDIVFGDKAYVIDVNPRPTTAIIGLVKTLKAEIGDLILMNMFGRLPESVSLEGECTFTKDDIEDII